VPSFGSGGAVFVDTEEQAQLARLLRLHYKTNNQDPQRGMGINSTMNAFEVASVTVCLKYHLEWQARRHKIACYYRDQFGDRVSLSYDPHAPEQKNTLHKLVARHKSRPRIFQKLHADNILIHPMYIPLYVEPVFKSLEKHGTCSTSSRMGFEGFLIPNQHTLTDSEVEFVTDKILAIL
jgi:dTDP-4-amino-4,6-dideoxygalactose transaminase